MASQPEIGHPHLPMLERGLAGFAARPRMMVYLATGICVALGWAYFLTMSAAMAPIVNLSVLGPGMQVIEWLFGAPGSAAVDHVSVHNYWGMPKYGAWDLTDLALIFVMWVMMALAMMVPTAAPMLSTYADLADTAAREGKKAASVLVLGAGYLSVWIGFALVATLLQWGLTELRLMSPLMEPVQTVLAGTTLVAAGLYQFTPAKHACLTKCQSPFPFFFSRWTDATSGVFGLGVEQGLFCLGCCWAMMMVMFAFGVMNVVWIALLAILMAAEKTVASVWVPRGIGIVFLMVGGLILVFSEPGRAICGFA